MIYIYSIQFAIGQLSLSPSLFPYPLENPTTTCTTCTRENRENKLDWDKRGVLPVHTLRRFLGHTVAQVEGSLSRGYLVHYYAK